MNKKASLILISDNIFTVVDNKTISVQLLSRII